MKVLKTSLRPLPPPPAPATTKTTIKVDTTRSPFTSELKTMKENWRLRAPIFKTTSVGFSVRHAPNVRRVIREMASRSFASHVLSEQSRRLKRQTSSSDVVTDEDDGRSAKPQDAEGSSKELKETSMNMSNAPVAPVAPDDVASRERSRAGEKS
jgi:hypothetical protein